MLSKGKLKYIRSLEHKKYRLEEQAFVAEGPKIVGELLNVFRCKLLLATEEWLHAHSSVVAAEIVEVMPAELQRASFLQTPQQVLAVFESPAYSLSIEKIKTSLCLALDDIQDPGNLGTIIRIADWFGIETIIASLGTADAFAPKAVQATMGAIARVQILYTALPELLSSLTDVPIYGTFLDGENIYEQSLSATGVLVMGNEGKGICPKTAQYVNRKLYIPPFPAGRATSESLNVAVATALACAEFRRRLPYPDDGSASA
ncbi:MAG: RNA methyltransferase [Prevotellaceae bacterium]|jgi:TrmH family RNA methyltransferase|nr:RNA methyltransferase [Prevotellaceae bacterium]